MTDEACSDCGKPAPYALQHVQRIGSRWVVWRECWDCYQAAEKRAAAIREEIERERQIKQLPGSSVSESGRRRPTTAAPFALQIEESA